MREERQNEREITQWELDRMEEQADRDEQTANLKRYGEACLMMEPYFPDGHIDYPRCKILWGRDRAITWEAYEKLCKEDELRMQKRLDNRKWKKEQEELASHQVQPVRPPPPPPPLPTPPLPEGTVPPPV